MARKPRIHYPGAHYHVMLRGNGGMEIFGDDQDHCRLLLILQEGIERFGYRVYAYCLMNNHIHLVIQVGDVPLSRAMQNLSFRFTRCMNWRNKRTGLLFQGRYKAILVEADEYLLQLAAYLHLNPVRAGMTNDPLDYRWSSHRAYMGKESVPWLSYDAVLSQLSKRRTVARTHFANFVAEQAGLGHRKEFHGIGNPDSRIIGDDDFLTDILGRVDQQSLTLPDLSTCIRLVTSYFKIDAEALRQPGRKRRDSRVRAFLAWAVLEHSSASLTALALWLNRDVSTLSSGIRRLQEKAGKQEDIRQDMKGLKSQLQDIAIIQA